LIDDFRLLIEKPLTAKVFNQQSEIINHQSRGSFRKMN